MGLFSQGSVPAACFGCGGTCPTTGSPSPSVSVSRDTSGLHKGRADLQHLCTNQMNQLLAKQGRKISSSKVETFVAKKTPFHSCERSPRYTVIYSFLCITSHSCEMVFCYKAFYFGEVGRGGEGALSEFATSPSPCGVLGNPQEHHSQVCGSTALHGGTSKDWELWSSGPGGSGVCKPCCPHCRRALRLPQK